MRPDMKFASPCQEARKNSVLSFAVFAVFALKDNFLRSKPGKIQQLSHPQRTHTRNEPGIYPEYVGKNRNDPEFARNSPDKPGMNRESKIQFYETPTPPLHCR
jgi:hypothetical protein